MNVSATNHGYNRLINRTRLPLSSLQQLIKSNLFIPLGQEGKKTHLLFYSYPDDDCFVAVYDPTTGDVISILGKYWHPTRCFYDVNTETLRKAKELVVGKKQEVKPIIVPQPLPPKPQVETTKYFIQACSKRITTFHTSLDINEFFASEEFAKIYLPTIVGSINQQRIPKATKLQYARAIIDVPYEKLKKINCSDTFLSLIKKAGAYKWEEQKKEEQARKKLYENYHKHLEKMKEAAE